jgi:hypothetical protein
MMFDWMLEFAIGLATRIHLGGSMVTPRSIPLHSSNDSARCLTRRASFSPVVGEIECRRFDELFFLPELGAILCSQCCTFISMLPLLLSPLAASSSDKEAVRMVIGIDLRTTLLCIGVFLKGKVEIIANEPGSPITAFIVSFIVGRRFAGDSAMPQLTANPRNTLSL